MKFFLAVSTVTHFDVSEIVISELTLFLLINRGLSVNVFPVGEYFGFQ